MTNMPMVIWNIFIVSAFVYAISYHNWSPWWMALAVILLAHRTDKK